MPSLGTPRPTPTGASAGLTARVGVLLYDTSFEVDPLVTAAVAAVRRRGIAVAGLRQSFGHRLGNGKRAMWLHDIGTGATIRLDRPRGPGATACILDPDALARAAWLLGQCAASTADLVVVNRFGHAEAEGRGMRGEIADAIGAGKAVLIPVRFSLLPDLEGFLGGPAHLLLPAADAITAWAEQVVYQREQVGG